MSTFSRAQIFVKDINRALVFYKQAFGFETRYVHDSGQYAELETGAVRLAVASEQIAVMTLGEGGFQPNDPEAPPAGSLFAIVVDDVETAFATALTAGAVVVKEPFTQPWGQQLALVRDPDGALIEIEKWVGEA